MHRKHPRVFSLFPNTLSAHYSLLILSWKCNRDLDFLVWYSDISCLWFLCFVRLLHYLNFVYRLHLLYYLNFVYLLHLLYFSFFVQLSYLFHYLLFYYYFHRKLPSQNLFCKQSSTLSMLPPLLCRITRKQPYRWQIVLRPSFLHFSSQQ